MSHYVVVFYKISVSEPEKEEHFKIRISNREYLLGNIKELINDAISEEITILTERINDDEAQLNKFIRQPDGLRPGEKQRTIQKNTQEILKLQRNLQIFVDMQNRYNNFKDPFNIPSAIEYGLTPKMEYPPEDSIFILSEDISTYDFEYYIDVRPFTGQELEYELHAH